MSTNNSSDQQFANNSDGFGLGGGTTARTLTVTGANVTLTGSGTNVYTFPAATDTLLGRASTDTLTNKTYDTAGTGNAFKINGTSISAVVGSGSVVLASAAPTATPTASTISEWDANKNYTANAFIPGFTTTATAAGTTTLTISATETQVFTGSTTQTVKLPTTSVAQGAQYTVINQSTGAVTVQSSGANTITILAAGTSAIFTAVIATPTTAANWASRYLGLVAASGKVLTASNSLTLAGTDGTTQTFQATDTIVGRATTDTLTNKTIAGSTNSVSYNTFTSPYNFSVYLATTQNTGNNAFGKILYDTALYDTGSNFDVTTNHRFTCPLTGYYEFHAHTSNTSSTTVILSLYKNGSEYIRGDRLTGVGGVSISTGLKLVATDFIEVFVFGSAAVGIEFGTAPIYTWFNGFLRSPN